jgi:hypothetical protein
MRSKECNKLVRRGRYILAAAGHGPFLASFSAFRPPEPSKRSRMAFMRDVFLPALRRHMLEDDLHLDSSSTTDTVFEGLVALNGRLYLISDSGDVNRSSTGVYGLGSGAPFAMGAVMAHATTAAAVRIAASIDVWTGGPVQTLRQLRPS